MKSTREIISWNIEFCTVFGLCKYLNITRTKVKMQILSLIVIKERGREYDIKSVQINPLRERSDAVKIDK